MEEKKKIKEYFKDLIFDEEPHTYYHKGIEVPISVSGVIADFYEPFDSEKHSKNYAKRNGMSQEDVLAMWKEKADIACFDGTRVHWFAEQYVDKRWILPKCKKEEAVLNFWNSLPSHFVPVLLEARMYHFTYNFAGTADIVVKDLRDNSLVIMDFKTNSTDMFANKSRKWMQDPFCSLLETSFNKYQIQLSLYQLLLEQTGFKVSNRVLIHLLPDGDFKTYETDDYTKPLVEYLDNNYIN